MAAAAARGETRQGLPSPSRHSTVVKPQRSNGCQISSIARSNRLYHQRHINSRERSRARYLVVFDGKLLVVVRFTPSRIEPTSRFKVFEETERDDEEGNDDPNFPFADYIPMSCAWSELNTLDGRMLFVGHGCSRSYRVDKYPGFEEGIYFLDDGEYFDDAVLFSLHQPKRYPCIDNGKWSEGRVERCFPRSDPSDHSAPVWLLP
ncbi:hypothetical protein HU200_000905 [Digitaria exilis]|uniref:KIB1-4 beta-propeller domain-containing protein n=1 Tax=Digitaria exilis TaxID=1010633 RepID=A0A835KV72_9POAL|nr:hypothetical protein HU200_000905 [Digitaria exilis]